MSRKPKPRQLELVFKCHGGARSGAGRPPKGEKAGVSHDRRAPLASRFPVHVTMRLCAGLPRLRAAREDALLREIFSAANEHGVLRVVHYSIQDNHLHLIAEAKDRRSLSRGMQGLAIRIAQTLNKHWSRTGAVFADRYHDRILRTPREVRNALVYVLHNAKKHGYRIAQGIDRFSSGAWFEGWKEKVRVRGLDAIMRPVAAARSWLLRLGFTRGGGRISVFARPKGADPG